jgi:hypothetical protein
MKKKEISTKSTRGLKYISDGGFLPGIPARDLTADEVEQNGGREWLLSTGLYAEVEEEEDGGN